MTGTENRFNWFNWSHWLLKAVCISRCRRIRSSPGRREQSSTGAMEGGGDSTHCHSTGGCQTIPMGGSLFGIGLPAANSMATSFPPSRDGRYYPSHILWRSPFFFFYFFFFLWVCYLYHCASKFPNAASNDIQFVQLNRFYSAGWSEVLSSNNRRPIH